MAVVDWIVETAIISSITISDILDGSIIVCIVKSREIDDSLVTNEYVYLTTKQL